MKRKIKGERPKIGVDLHTLEGLHQGSRTHCLEIFSRAIAYLPEVEFVLFVDTTRWSESNARRFDAPNAEVVHMAHTGSILRILYYLPMFALRYRLDLLHTQYICPIILPSKTVVTIHDILFENFPQYFEGGMRVRSKILFRLSAYLSEMVFTVSDYSRHELENQYHVRSSKLKTIYNAASVDRFFPGNEGAAEVSALGVIPGEYLLSVGRLEPRKNHVGLLQAMALLSKPRPKLLIVGQPDFGFEAMLQLRRELQLEEDVILLDSVEDDLLPALYRSAKIFLYPTFAEGFGMPVIEAMASGIPVISSNTTSLPEIAGDAAILVSPHEPEAIRAGVERVLNDDSLSAEMSRLGLKQAQRFNWEVSAQVVAETYRCYFFESSG